MKNRNNEKNLMNLTSWNRRLDQGLPIGFQRLPINNEMSTASSQNSKMLHKEWKVNE